MDEYDKRIFAKNLNRFMQLSNKKQTDICQLLRVSKSTVSSWCSGQKMPRMDKIEVLANYFGILKSDLIEEKPTTVSDDWLKALLQEPYVAEILDTLKKLTPERQKIALIQLQALADTGTLEGNQGK